MIEGGTFVQESEGYDLLPMVNERDEASTWSSAKLGFSQSVSCGDGGGVVDKADMFGIS
jgi:hypothetical protein